MTDSEARAQLLANCQSYGLPNLTAGINLKFNAEIATNGNNPDAAYSVVNAELFKLQKVYKNKRG